MKVKPTYQTTEFILTLIKVVIILMFGVGLIDENVLGTILSLLAGSIVVGSYSISRGIAKRGQHHVQDPTE